MPSERVQRAVDQLLDEAVTASAKGDWGTVLSLAQRVLTLDPDNADALDFKAAAQRGHAHAEPSPDVIRGTAANASPSHTNPHPTSFASGRYAVKRFLGEGGKKKVYLAHDTTLDRDVAFALIKSEGLDEPARRRILREAQAMGRLGDHPNIVPIHDLGTEGSQPFMVLPLMQGGDVEGLIETARDHRPPLDQVLRVAKDVCEGLAFAHGKGIVHRDVKPGNVWLTEDPASSNRWSAKIGDFGLALPLDQSRLTREGFMVGTVAYMPPEQAMGGDITPRADLYSLGCMLYEMVTGRPPFLGDDDIAIIGQHINTPPVAPSWHNSQCPKPLEALIMRLLAKDPAQRPQSAKDVLVALEAVDLAVPPAAPTVPGAQQDQARSLDSMSSGVFVGRHKEMDQLRAALEETLSGHGRMVTLVGEPGIGKTRTAQELQTYAGLRRCQVLWGRCYEGGGAPPYWPWVQAIRQYVREREPEQIKREMGSSASVIAEVVADVRDRLPGLQSPPQLDSPEAARFRLFDSIASFLRSASSAQPVVLVIDDLHWADKPTLLLLEFVARELANTRTLLVGTYRDVELNRRHPLALTLGDLTKERLFERVLLRGLSKQDVGKFIEVAAGLKPPQGLIDAVHTQTEGNPLFVTEVVRLLVQEGHLTPDKLIEDHEGQRSTRGRGKTTTWIVRVPEGVREVIGRRLNRLSERCNGVLAIAAVIGRQFSIQQLLAVLNDPSAPPEDRASQDRLFEYLEEALATRVIEELPNAVGHYQFTHALIQETLTNELSTTHRVRLHGRIARSLESYYGSRAEDHAEELVHHFGESETLHGPRPLIKYSLIAGQRALSSYAPHEAERYFSRALASKSSEPPDVELADLVFGLGKAQTHTLGRVELQKAVDTLRRAFDLYDRLGMSEKKLEVGVTFVSPVRSLSGKLQMIESSLPLAKEGSREQADLLSQHALWVNWERADYETARSDIDHSLRIARATGDTLLEFRTLSNAAIVHQSNLNNEDFGSAVATALRLAESVNDPGSAVPLYHVASTSAALDRGDYGEADRLAKAASRLAGRVHNSHLMITGFFAQATVQYLQGNWDATRELLLEGLNLDPREMRLLAIRAAAEIITGESAGIDASLRVMAQVAAISAEGGNEQLAFGRTTSLAALFGFRFEDFLTKANGYARAALGNPRRELVLKVSAAETIGCIALATSDPKLAEEASKLLQSMQGSRTRRRYLFIIDGGMLDGALARLLGDREASLGLLEQEVADLRKVSRRPRLAVALYELSETLISRGTAADRTSAAKAQDESLSIARDLGMKPLIERIIARKKILKA